jgi:two-component system phosphate regulon response regulator PhoB
MSSKSNNLVLVVDRDQSIACALDESFQEAHLDIVQAYSADEGLKVAQSNSPRVILADIDLPDMSGFNFHRKVLLTKKIANTPFIYFTERTSEMDVVVGFELGASDYIPKSVSGREVALRIQAILKRIEPIAVPDVLSIGKIRLDISKNAAFKDGERILLTITEFHILAALAAAEGRVLSRRAIVTSAWKNDGNIASRTVDVHVKSMRPKLLGMGVHIQTVRGIGYSLRLTDDENCPADFKPNVLKNQSHQDENNLASMMQQPKESRTESGR